MKEINDGGPAFPCPDTVHPNGQVQYGTFGMSLRDYFAGQALAGMAAGDYWAENFQNVPHYIENVAHTAYQVADAMIAASNKPTE